jgi:hypothetical protein
MKTSPVSAVKAAFQSKDKLVEAVQKLATSDLWLDRVNSVKGLGRVSNKKLLRLHALLSDVQKRFGSRAKLVDAILTLEKRTKDAGYKARLETYALPRLVDAHGVASKRQAKGEAKAKSKAAPKKVAPKKAPAAAKAPAKKAPAKKAPAKKAKKG